MKRYRQSTIPRNVVMLGIVSFFTDAASEMIYPLIPVFVSLMGAGALILGVIEGVAETTAAVVKILSGIVSDRIGKRKVLVIVGYTISSLIRPFTGIVSAAWQIVFIRMLDRVGKGVRSAPRDALIASSVDPWNRGRAYGFHRAMDHAGAVAGPLLTLCTLSILTLSFRMTDSLLILRWTFGLVLVPGMMAVLTIIFLVEEKAAPSAGRRGSAPFSLTLFDRNFLAYLLIVLLFTLGNSSDAFLLFRVGEAVQGNNFLHALLFDMPFVRQVIGQFGDTESQRRVIDILLLPLIWAYFHGIKVMFSTHLGALSDRIGRKRSINIGWGIYAFVYLSFAFLDTIPGNWQLAFTFILFALYALFYAFCEGAEKAFVADVVKPEVYGSAFGMYNLAVGVGSLPASILFGIIYSRMGAAVAFGIGAALAAVSMVLLALVVEERSRGGTNHE